jgi:hypothetical protein
LAILVRAILRRHSRTTLVFALLSIVIYAAWGLFSKVSADGGWQYI